MDIKELEILREKAIEQLTANYACYFGVRDAEIMIELIDDEIVRMGVMEEAQADSERECEIILHTMGFNDSECKRLRESIEEARKHNRPFLV